MASAVFIIKRFYVFKSIFFYDFALFLVDASCRNHAADGGKRINIGIVADDRARIQDGTAAHFHAVAQHGAEFLKACLDFFLSGFDYHEFFYRISHWK